MKTWFIILFGYYIYSVNIFFFIIDSVEKGNFHMINKKQWNKFVDIKKIIVPKLTKVFSTNAYSLFINLKFDYKLRNKKEILSRSIIISIARVADV